MIKVLKSRRMQELDRIKFVDRVEARVLAEVIAKEKEANKPKLKTRVVHYTDGAEGMIKWCDDKVRVPIYPEGSDTVEWTFLRDLPTEINPKTNKSYHTIWDEQKKILREALRMENHRFVYRLIVLCWMRGEGKSLLACLIQLWKFFSFPRQQIMLGANSRDQVKFVHYDIMRDIILNSPELVAQIGKRNIQEKEIRMKDNKGRLQSLIRSISSFSGIVSNITGYTFSEIFDMKNPRFFVQLDGSIRNMPNSFGVIDSTLSEKTHVLYQLYHSFLTKKTKGVFFSYRHSKLGKQEDYWNPHMDDDQLNDYKVKFPFGEYERYFLNLWSAGHIKVFTDEMIEEAGIIGYKDRYMNHKELTKAIDKKYHFISVQSDMMEKGFDDGVQELALKITDINSRMMPIEEVYSLRTPQQISRMAIIENLEALGEILDTEWAVGVGLDMADPMAIRSKARTIMTLTAKGLIGSRSNPYLYDIEGSVPHYVYFLLHAVDIQKHSLEAVKALVDTASEEFDGIDTLCGERWGLWDMSQWCEQRDIIFEALYPTYDRQREAFKEVFTLMDTGRLKIPPLAIVGSKSDDIWKEEAGIFDHDPDKRWFGSPEKHEKYGIQDDFIYSLGWGIYGMRYLTVEDFRARKSTTSFGLFYQGAQVLGKY